MGQVLSTYSMEVMIIQFMWLQIYFKNNTWFFRKILAWSLKWLHFQQIGFFMKIVLGRKIAISRKLHTAHETSMIWSMVLCESRLQIIFYYLNRNNLFQIFSCSSKKGEALLSKENESKTKHMCAKEIYKNISICFHEILNT